MYIYIYIYKSGSPRIKSLHTVTRIASVLAYTKGGGTSEFHTG